MNQWKPNLTVAAIIERDGRFLMVEERADDRVVLNQPAGHVEHGESLVEAVCREVKEETTCLFTPQALVGIYRLERPNHLTYFRVCFAGDCSDEDTQQQRDPDIIRTLWLNEAELHSAAHRLRSTLVWRCLSDYLNGSRHPLSLLQDCQPG